MKSSRRVVDGVMALCDAPVGAVVTVVEVQPGPHGQGRRLEDLGIVAGTEVTVERRAPLGDPTVYEVRRARLAVRRVDALLVQVAVGDAAEGTYVAL
ncbi:MAG: FeoA family protein [Ilumatobacteraceae bacterium]